MQRKRHKAYAFVALALLLLCGGSIASFLSYQTYSSVYHRYMSLAQRGEQHLQTAESLLAINAHNSLSVQHIDQARLEFVAASQDFAQVNDVLRFMPSAGTQLPYLGTKIHAALHLLPLAQDAAQAGIIGCGVLKTLFTTFQQALQKQGQGLTPQNITLMNTAFHSIQSVLSNAIDEANQLQPGDLQFDPRMAKTFASLQKYLPSLRTWLTDAATLAPMLPSLLGIGKPANYLIEVLDSTELRPGGGFIGNYGIATLSGGKLAGAAITDVDLLDKPFYAAGNRISFPQQYAWFGNYLELDSWSLRDSNLDADFPTDARYAEANYTREGGKVAVQGVIALTPAFIQQVLTITGPISVPEYNETVTAQNFIERIHYHQLGAAGVGPDSVASPDGYSSLRKHFTALLAEHLMNRIHQLSLSTLPQFGQLLLNSLYTKDIQVYLNSQDAERLLQSNHLDSAIQPAPGDELYVVDANVAANKANAYISSVVSDQVTLDAAGTALHHTVLTYAWNTAGDIYSNNPYYKDYLRLYIPMKSSLLTPPGGDILGTQEAFGYKVVTGFFMLVYGQVKTITIVWKEPGAASKDAQGWHYRYLLQHQAGLVRDVTVSLQMPTCAGGVNFTGGLVAHAQHDAVFHQVLTRDQELGVDYGCA